MQLNVALIRMVFSDRSASDLREVLKQVRSRGANLAVLPELPLNVWSPASKVVQKDEAEPPGGPRHLAMSEAARGVGIALIGGAIIQDAKTGRCQNSALVFDRSGALIGSYRNCTYLKRRASGRRRIMIPVMSHHLWFMDFRCPLEFRLVQTSIDRKARTF